MKTFNLTSYYSGRIVKTVEAKTMQDAQNQLESKGYNCQDDYFLESVEDATAEYLKAGRYAQIQNLLNEAEENDANYLLINYRN
jgi:hypothetical protein